MDFLGVQAAVPVPFVGSFVQTWVAVASSFVVGPSWAVVVAVVAVAAAASSVVARPFGLASAEGVPVLAFALAAVASGFAGAVVQRPGLAFADPSWIFASTSEVVHQPVPARVAGPLAVVAGIVPFEEVAVAVVVVPSTKDPEFAPVSFLVFGVPVAVAGCSIAA